MVPPRPISVLYRKGRSFTRFTYLYVGNGTTITRVPTPKIWWSGILDRTSRIHSSLYFIKKTLALKKKILRQDFFNRLYTLLDIR